MKKKKPEKLNFKFRPEQSKLKTEHGKSKKIFAKKSFGQNFLVDETYVNKIISALAPQPNETVVEIGAGRGALTEKLIESGANVIAVEFERDMIEILREQFSSKENFRLLEQDALKIDFAKLYSESNIQNSKFKLVANLPFYISTAILQKLIEEREVFSEMILMFQREVVDRITAEPGTRERGFLTVLVEANLVAEKLFDVPPNAFRPAPQVWSSVVRLVNKLGNNAESPPEQIFRELVSVSFRQKRKTLINNLTGDADFLKKYALDKDKILSLLNDLNIEPTRRAESLTLNEWKALSKCLE